MICFYFSELWWRHEAPTQHNGSWYARSEHVRVAVWWIKMLPSKVLNGNVAELSSALSTQGPRDWTTMAQSQQCQLCEC